MGRKRHVARHHADTPRRQRLLQRHFVLNPVRTYSMFEDFKNEIIMLPREDKQRLLHVLYALKIQTCNYRVTETIPIPIHKGLGVYFQFAT